MPRALFPHSLGDVLHAVDGPFGLVVGDLPDGTIWVLKRGRREPGFTLTQPSPGAVPRSSKVMVTSLKDWIAEVVTLWRNEVNSGSLSEIAVVTIVGV